MRRARDYVLISPISHTDMCFRSPERYNWQSTVKCWSLVFGFAASRCAFGCVHALCCASPRTVWCFVCLFCWPPRVPLSPFLLPPCVLPFTCLLRASACSRALSPSVAAPMFCLRRRRAPLPLPRLVFSLSPSHGCCYTLGNLDVGVSF